MDARSVGIQAGNAWVKPKFARSVRYALRSVIIRGLSVVLGTFLLVSAGFHLNNNVAFYETVLSYRVFGRGASMIVAGLLPTGQFLLGSWLVVGLHKKTSSGIAAGLLAVFTLAQLSAYFRGLNIDCGCFGPASGLVSIGSISLATLLTATAVLIFVLHSRQPDFS